jgi:hypothetical protein
MPTARRWNLKILLVLFVLAGAIGGYVVSRMTPLRYSASALITSWSR